MLTNETDQTLHKNLIVSCRVDRVLDRALKVTLTNGLDGIIPGKFISESNSFETPRQLGFREGQALTCCVLIVNKEKLLVELSCRPSDLERYGKEGVDRDEYFCHEWEQVDLKEDMALQKRKKFQNARFINHPDFRNIDHRQAEELMRDKPPGFYVIRPSTKGADHLSITWKISNGIFQHIDILVEEQGGYTIDHRKFTELDELIILFIEPMGRLVKDILGLKPPKYQECNLETMKSIISKYADTQKRSSYGFILAPQKPGSFFFVYQHVGSRPKCEYVTVKPEGYHFRGKVFKKLDDLIGGFKQMEQKKAVERKKQSSRSRSRY